MDCTSRFQSVSIMFIQELNFAEWDFLPARHIHMYICMNMDNVI